MAHGNELSDALALEKIDLSESVNDAIAEADVEIQALKRELAAQGSGRHVREWEIRFTKLATNIVEKAIAKRRELGRRFPELLTPPLLTQLKERLNHHVDAIVNGEKNRIAMGGHGYGASHIPQAQIKAAGLKSRIAQRLEALRLEANLGLNAEEKPVTIFNISDSTIASLNLGTVFGDLTASVQTLSGHGQRELAEAFRKIAEALTTATALNDAYRKELLEHLSVVAEGAALPPEKRKIGPLRTSIAFLREGIADVAQLATLWPPTEELLKRLGVLS
jgi:hypothetical protein